MQKTWRVSGTTGNRTGSALLTSSYPGRTTSLPREAVARTAIRNAMLPLVCSPLICWLLLYMVRLRQRLFSGLILIRAILKWTETPASRITCNLLLILCGQSLMLLTFTLRSMSFTLIWQHSELVRCYRKRRLLQEMTIREWFSTHILYNPI